MSKVYKGTALDMIQTVYMEEYVPIAYCFIRFNSALDIIRLHNAVRRTAETVPQILYRYSYERHRWISSDFDTDSIIHVTKGELRHESGIWDLQAGPQLKINVFRNGQQDSVQICMSHILTDGAGFLQYLYLLCGCYNDPHLLVPAAANRRSMTDSIFRTMPYRFRYFHGEQPNNEAMVLLPAGNDKRMPVSLTATITDNQLHRIKDRVSGLGITLNDLFMAAYAHTMKNLLPSNSRNIQIPCPANLRKYDKRTKQLTIANMTGKYICSVPRSLDCGIEEMAAIIHENMLQHKARYDCFKSLPLLMIAHALFSKNIVRLLIKRFYTIEPISYTNLGIIDDDKLFFDGLEIMECYLCGTYRPAPSFQLSISTYKNTCTMASNLLCTQEQKDAGARLLNEMVTVLLSMWNMRGGER